MANNQPNRPDGIHPTAHWAAATSIKFPSHKAVPNAVVNFYFYLKLSELNWTKYINDEILNFALIQLFHSNLRLPNVIILDTFATRGSSSWVKQISSNTDWDYAIFPINISNYHWILGAYSKTNERMYMLDSSNIATKLPLKDHKVFSNLGVEETTPARAESVPRQQDGYNCGLVVIQMARTLSQDSKTLAHLFATGSWPVTQNENSAHVDIGSTAACLSLRKQIYNDILIASMDPNTWAPVRLEPGVQMFGSR